MKKNQVFVYFPMLYGNDLFFFTKDEFKKKEGQVFVRLYSDEKYFLNNHICLFSRFCEQVL